jgi:hypothetical protein
VQPGPETLQAIVVLGLEPDAGVNVAWYVADAPAFTTDGPEIASVNPLAIVSVTLALMLVSAALVAVTVSLGGCGSTVGAV